MKKLLLPLLLFGFMAASANAAELTAEDRQLLEMKPEELLGSELTSPSVSKYWEEQGATSVSKKGEDPFNTPAAVYIISSEDIRRSGVTSVMEALRMAPGVQVARIDSNKWAISIRGFNYIYSNKVNVLQDGQSIINPLISGVFWDENMTPIEEVDRIEIIRGSGGVTWGTNAINGVINIITKNSKDTQGKFISALYGGEEKGTIYARYGNRTSDGIFYRNFIEHKSIGTSEGAYTGRNLQNDWRNSQAGFRVDRTNVENEKLLITGVLYSDNTDGYLNTFPEPPIPNVFRPKPKEASGGYINGRISQSSDRSENTLQSHLRYNSFTIEGFRSDSFVYDIDFQQTWAQSPRSSITWGTGYRLYSDRTTPTFYIAYEPASQLDNLFSAFLQNKYAVIENELYLTLGSKFEYQDKVGFEPQPTARLSYSPTNNQTFWAAISRIARFPTRSERNVSRELLSISPFGADPTDPDGSDAFAYFGSNDPSSKMKSNKSIEYELGYKIKPLNSLSFDFTAFYNNYTDLITYTPTRQGNDLYFVFQDTNKGEGTGYGAEISADWQATSDLKLEGTYSLIDVKVVIPPLDQTLDNFADNPRHQFGIRSQYNIRENIFWDNSLYYVDGIENFSVPDYLRLDTRLAWNPIHNLELSITGQNLLDDYHQEFADSFLSEPSTIGRSVYVKAAWEF